MPPANESTDVADALRQTYEKSLNKKKKKNNEDIELLENLKKGGDSLRKDEDKLAEANLMKDKNERLEVGKTNLGYEDDGKLLKKKKSSTAKELDEKMAADAENKDSVPLEHNIGEEKPKKKKKKKRIPDMEMVSTTQGSGDAAEIAETRMDGEPSVERTSEDNIDDNQSGDPDNAKTPGKKKAKKKKKKKAGGYTELKDEEKLPETDSDATDGSAVPVPKIDTNFEEDHRILGITVHRTDRLKQDKYITRPAVRVYVMDINTQNYVKKEDQKRELQLPHPPGYESLESYPPLATSEFDYKKRQSLIPRWEEQLFVDERYLYFIENETEKGSPDTIVFFEIVNQLAENTSRGQKGRSNWMRVAWAFLKLVGGNRSLNVEKKVRLQLFYPFKQFTNSNEPKGDVLDGGEVMDWFVGMRRIKYPATLYVTVKGTHVSAANLPRKTFGHITEAESEGYDDTADESAKAAYEEEPTWSRMPGQICKIPNKMFKSLKAGRAGCSVLRFSNAGRKLACACGDKQGGYIILVYEIPSGKFLGQFPGHFNIIYDICWAKTDFEIITCSQDGSVLSWDVERMKKAPVKMFTHPSYVYCAKYHPFATHIIVSGCYDNVIRVWSSLSSGKEGTLLRELQAHNGFVNCICFNAPGNTMYSCDSVGTVITWKVDLTAETVAGTLESSTTASVNASEWMQERIFTDPEISDVPISVVQLHGSGRRLLLQCRDNTTRVLDLRLNIIMARYTGAINFKDHIRSTFTPCGTYIFSSSEDFTAVVWNTDTSETVCTYRDLGFTSSISDICFHPFEHMVAFCAIGQSQPIVIYSYDYMVPDKHVAEVDENMMTDNEMAAMNIPSAATTPRIQSFRSKSPLLSSAAFHGLGPSTDAVGAHQASSSGKPDLLTKSTRELASEIIQNVRLEQVNRKLDTTNIQDPQSLRGTRRSRSRDGRMIDGIGGEADGNSTARSIARSDISDSSFALGGTSRGFIRPGDLVKQVDSEMPGTRMTMFIQGEQPKFLVSAKTGISEWARVEVDYTAQRSDELSLTKGGLVKIVLKDNDMWWLGEVGRKQGYVPSKCLQLISESDAQAMALHEKEIASQAASEGAVAGSSSHSVPSVTPSAADRVVGEPRSASTLKSESPSLAQDEEVTTSGSAISETSRARRRIKKNVAKGSGSNGPSPTGSDNNSAEEGPPIEGASSSKPLQTIQDIEEELFVVD